jgi:hypothetical protein
MWDKMKEKWQIKRQKYGLWKHKNGLNRCIGSSMSNFKIITTTIPYKGMNNDDNGMCMMNVDANVNDLKY